MKSHDCIPDDCSSKKSICLPINSIEQKAITAVPIDGVLPPKEKTAYGYKYNPDTITSSEPNFVVPFTSTGPINNITSIQNGFKVEKGVYAIATQIVIPENVGALQLQFSLAINNEPLNTTIFHPTSNISSSGAFTVHSLNSGDSITLLGFNQTLQTITLDFVAGNFFIMKLK